MFSIKDLDVSLADIKSTSIVYMAVKDLLFYPSWKPPRLPVAYQEVEYIESTGSQYINTWVSANQYLSFEADFQALWTTNETTLFGARSGSWTNRFWLMIYGWKFNMMVGNTSSLAWDKAIDNNRHQGSVFLNNWDFTGKFDWEIDTGSAWTSVYVNTNFLLFKYDYNSAVSCPSRLFSFKLYTGGSNLVRDYVPCYRKEDNVVWLYDLVTNEFYTNSWSWSFTRWDNVEYSLPKEYSEVYYIQSRWTQYIDTWFITNPNTKARVDFQFTSLVKSANCFWNTGSWPSSSWAVFNWYLWDSAWKFKFWIANWLWTDGVWNNPVMNSDTNRHTFEWKNWKATIYTCNPVTSVSTVTSVNTVKTITQSCSHSSLLFAWRDPDVNAPAGQCSWKLYWCTIFESEVMVRNFIPCIRKKDKKPWLYDFVTKRFFVNAWTGEFTYWAEKLYTQTKNTVAYYPLENDTNDYSWNKMHLTNNGATFVTEDWVRVWYNDNNTSKYARWGFALTSWNNPFTISLFAKNKSKTNYWVMVWTWYGSWTQWANVFFKDNQLYFWWWTNDTASWFVSTWKWLHIVFTFDWTTGKLYVDWELKVSKNVTYSVPTSIIYTTLFANYIWNVYSPTDAFYWYLSQVIAENRAWTVKDINKYRKSIADRYVDKLENYQEVEYIGRNGNNYIDT